MSPSESQLRAALHDGEGQSLDVDALVTGARRARRERRRRLVAVAAAVVVVATVGAGSRLLLRGGDTDGGPPAALGNSQPALSTVTSGTQRPPTRSERTAGSVPAAAGSVPAAAGSVAASAAARLAAGLACPAQLPRLALPGGGGSGQVGSSAPLFSAPVAAVKVCAYPNIGTAAVPVPSSGSRVLSGADASNLAHGLEVAAKSRAGQMCPGALARDGVRGLAIYAVTAAGRELHVVTATLTCPTTVTNGTSVRYDWSPPDSLTTLVTPHHKSP